MVFPPNSVYRITVLIPFEASLSFTHMTACTLDPFPDQTATIADSVARWLTLHVGCFKQNAANTANAADLGR